MSERDKLPNGNLPVVEKQIGESLYHVTRMGWWDVQVVIGLLNEILGPSLCTILTDSHATVQTVLDMPGDKAGEALVGALRQAVGRDGQRLQEMLGRQTMVETDGRRVILEQHTMGIWFSQHPKDMIPWLVFALEVQVRDFFEPLINQLGIRLASAQSGPGTSESPGQASRST